MVDFDPVAMEAMLKAFYPIVGPAAFARARAERPAYFAGGVIIGTHGDALLLPDHRIFDCIFDVLGPHTRWQCILAEGGGADPDDPWKLEPGPLVPIDLSEWAPGQPVPIFRSLVAQHLAPLGSTDAILNTAYREVLYSSDKRPLEDAYAGHMDPARVQLGAEPNALNGIDPTPEIGSLRGQGESIDAFDNEYNEYVPPDV